jgi:hypothetical protein
MSRVACGGKLGNDRIVGLFRLSLAISFTALGVLAGCGLSLSGDGNDSDDSSPVRDAGHVTLDGSGKPAKTPDASGSDDASSSDDGDPPGDDAGGSGDDTGTSDDDDDASDDATALPDVAAPVEAGAPCAALKVCCVQVDKLSSSTGCDSAVKANYAPTCATVLADLESAGLCK